MVNGIVSLIFLFSHCLQISFGLIFVYGLIQRLNFILSLVSILFSQDHLMTKLSFFSFMVLGPLSKIIWSYIWVLFWASVINFYSIPFIYICLYAITTAFWLLLAWSKIWNKKVWGLEVCYSFLKLFWLFGVPWVSI